MVKSVT